MHAVELIQLLGIVAYTTALRDRDGPAEADIDRISAAEGGG
jgi:hypothetical protein